MMPFKMKSTNFERPKSVQTTNQILKHQFQLMRDKYSPNNVNTGQKSQQKANFMNSVLTVSQLTPQLPLPSNETKYAQQQVYQTPQYNKNVATPQQKNQQVQNQNDITTINFLNSKIEQLQSSLSIKSSLSLDTVSKDKYDKMIDNYREIETNLAKEVELLKSKINIADQNNKNLKQQLQLQQNEFETKLLDKELEFQNKIIQFQNIYEKNDNNSVITLWKEKYNKLLYENQQYQAKSSNTIEQQQRQIDQLKGDNQNCLNIISNGENQYNALKGQINKSNLSFKEVKEDADHIVKELLELSQIGANKTDSMLSFSD